MVTEKKEVLIDLSDKLKMSDVIVNLLIVEGWRVVTIRIENTKIIRVSLEREIPEPPKDPDPTGRKILE